MPTGDELTVEYELTHDDYVESCARHLRDSPLTRKPLRAIQLLVFLLCVVVGLLQLLAGSLITAGVMVLAGVALALASPRLVRSAQQRQLLRTATAGVANGMFGRHRVTLLERGLRDETLGYEWTVRWEAIEAVKDAGDVLMVYIGPNAFLPIPATAFPDRATAFAFRDRFMELREAARTAARVEAAPVPDEDRPGDGGADLSGIDAD